MGRQRLPDTTTTAIHRFELPETGYSGCDHYECIVMYKDGGKCTKQAYYDPDVSGNPTKCGWHRRK